MFMKCFSVVEGNIVTSYLENIRYESYVKLVTSDLHVAVNHVAIFKEEKYEGFIH